MYIQRPFVRIVHTWLLRRMLQIGSQLSLKDVVNAAMLSLEKVIVVL